MNINLLSFFNNEKSSHICVKYGSEDVGTVFSVAGQRLYTIQRRRPMSVIPPCEDYTTTTETQKLIIPQA